MQNIWGNISLHKGKKKIIMKKTRKIEIEDKSLKKNELYMMYGTNYTQMTIQLLEEANLVNLIPSKDCRIGIKPNLVAPTEASWGATTHPEVVAGILEYLKRYGFTNLVMLEGSWVGDKTQDSIEVCGYQELSDRYEVPFLDMQKDTWSEVDCGGCNLRVCNEALKLDFLINVPVMKGHCQTKITCALKNMKGLIPNTEKRHFHSMGLHKPIAHLTKALHQDFIVVDNICGDWDFEDGGNPVVMNRIVVGRDPVLVDSWVCSEMGYDVKEVPYICYAEEMGAGSTDLKHAILRQLNQAQEEITIPRQRKIVDLQDAVEEVESCSACYGYLIPALDMLKEEGLLSELKEKIAIGQGYRGKTGELGVGNCTRKFKHHLGGCPPTEEQVYEFLKTYIQAKK